MSLESIDMNLLVALDALLSKGSVTGAAVQMNLSVPAMSRTLSRIRLALQDPILVRAGRGLVMTPRAKALRDRVHEVVEPHVQSCSRNRHWILPCWNAHFQSGSAMHFP